MVRFVDIAYAPVPMLVHHAESKIENASSVLSFVVVNHQVMLTFNGPKCTHAKQPL